MNFINNTTHLIGSRNGATRSQDTKPGATLPGTSHTNGSASRKPDTATSIDPVDADAPAHRSDGLRIDKTDGGAYELDDFISVYGGNRTNPPPEWALAETAGDAPSSHSSFEDMGLPAQLLHGVYEAGFDTPTPVQARAVAGIATGRDALLHALAGSGKTGAFGIGLLARLSPRYRHTQALVLSPTKDLAIQTARVLGGLGRHLHLRCHDSWGGRRNDGATIAKTRPAVVSGTPGRVLDNMGLGPRSRGSPAIDPACIRVLVIDEFDLMVGKFDAELKQIVNSVPADCQIVMASATIDPAALGVADKLLRDPIRVLRPTGGGRGATGNGVAAGVRQFFVDCGRDEHKLDTLIDLQPHLPPGQRIVFANSVRRAQWIAEQLDRELAEAQPVHKVGLIHGEMEPGDRAGVLQAFAQGGISTLVATDVVGRGLDTQSVATVVCWEPPRDHSCYVHRSGRVGRTGRKGLVLNLVGSGDEARTLEAFGELQAAPIAEMPADLAAGF